MPIVILAQPGDRPALRLAAALRTRYGQQHVVLVAGDMLVLARSWQHRIESGRVRSEVRLADGRSLSDAAGTVILNRLRHLHLPHFAAAKPSDATYAASEVQALVLSWLSSLSCPVHNRPSPAGLAGPDVSPLQWLMRAAKAGLPVRQTQFTTSSRRGTRNLSRPYRATANLSQLEPLDPATAALGPLLYIEDLAHAPSSVLLVGDRLVESVPTGLEEACRTFARSLGCTLLQFWFAEGARSAGPLLAGVSAFPDLQDPRELDAVCDLLAAEAKLAPQAA